MLTSRRFVLDLDSDEDEQEMDDPFAKDRSAIKDKQNARKQITDGEDWETDESEGPPEDMPECPNPDSPDCQCPECIWFEEHDRALMPSLEDGVKRDGHA